MLISNVENGNIEKALKILKAKVFSTKQLQELRDNREYEKPSIKKRKMLIKAKYKQSKNL